jgi:hypothetical protein
VNFEQIEALERLAELKRQGLLTDAEVETVKNRILSAGPAPAGHTTDEGQSHRPEVDQPAPPPERREEPEADLQPPVIEEHNVDEQRLKPEAEDSQSLSRGDTRKTTSTHRSAEDSRTRAGVQALARFEKRQRKKRRRTLIGALALIAIAVIGAVASTNRDSKPSTALDMSPAAIKDRGDERVSASASSTHPTVTPQEPASSQSEDSSPAVTGADRLTLVVSNYIVSNESAHCWKNQTELTIFRPEINYSMRDNAKVLLQSGKEELPPIPAGGVACHTVYTSEDHELSPTSDFTARVEGHGNSKDRTLTIESVSIKTEVALGKYYDFRNASFYSIAESFPKACMAGDDDRARRLVKANGGDVAILSEDGLSSWGDAISPCTYLFEWGDYPRLEATIRNPSNSDIDLEVIDVFWFNDGAALAHVELENTNPDIGVPAGETVRFEGDFEDFAWRMAHDNPHWLINQLTLVSSRAPSVMVYWEGDDMRLTSGIEMELSLKPAAQALFQISSDYAGFFGDPVDFSNISIEQRFPPRL